MTSNIQMMAEWGSQEDGGFYLSREELWKARMRQNFGTTTTAGQVSYKGFTIELKSKGYDFSYSVKFPNGIWSSGPYYRRDAAIADAKKQIDFHLEAGGSRA